MPEHVPVMVQEIVHYLQPEKGGCFLDGTLGLGGHSLELLKAGSRDLYILGMDRDRESLEYASRILQEQGFGSKVMLGHASYDNFPRVMKEAGWKELDAALLDLGISNLQIQDPDRGFSFLSPGKLDMRYDYTGGEQTAADLVNRASTEKLREIIKKYGEEPLAGRIARFISEARNRYFIEDTRELAELVSRAYPEKKRAQSKNHPATRTFQALRIAVNRELEKLQNFLNILPRYLKSGSRVAVLSYHSLEDRIVKRCFQQQFLDNQAKKQTIPSGQFSWQILSKKPITPSAQEIEQNKKSRSAKLRVAEIEKNED